MTDKEVGKCVKCDRRGILWKSLVIGIVCRSCFIRLRSE